MGDAVPDPHGAAPADDCADWDCPDSDCRKTIAVVVSVCAAARPGHHQLGLGDEVGDDVSLGVGLALPLGAAEAAPLALADGLALAGTGAPEQEAVGAALATSLFPAVAELLGCGVALGDADPLTPPGPLLMGPGEPTELAGAMTCWPTWRTMMTATIARPTPAATASSGRNQPPAGRSQLRPADRGECLRRPWWVSVRRLWCRTDRAAAVAGSSRTDKRMMNSRSQSAAADIMDGADRGACSR